MKNTAFAVGTTPLRIAVGPTKVILQVVGATWVGEQTITPTTTGIRADSFTGGLFLVLLPGEKLYAVADTSADVRVMEYGLP